MHSLYTPRLGRVQVFINSDITNRLSILKENPPTSLTVTSTPRTRDEALRHRNLVGLRSNEYHHSRVTANNDDLDDHDHAYVETTHCALERQHSSTHETTNPPVPPCTRQPGALRCRRQPPTPPLALPLAFPFAFRFKTAAVTV